jgi:exopolyphosphatase/guanosine-5'-triphosphate,3'-diphosphate pyrophosphatase
MKTLEAVIEMGSTGIRLMVCEDSPGGSWVVIDNAELPVALGWDVFTLNTVSRETLLQCLRILNRFKEQLAGWGIDDQHVTVIATSALREALNRDTVLDRIQVKTGFKVKVIDGIEENRLMYIAVLEALRDDLPEIKQSNSAILEIGGGSTEIMLLERGEMAAVHSLRLGTVIIEQHIKSMLGSQHDARRFLEDFIENAGVNLNTEFNLKKIQHFITIGHEARIAAQYVGEQIGTRSWKITREKFIAFTNEIQQFSPEECQAKFQVPYSDAKSLGVALFTYKLFMGLTDAKEIIVSGTTLREGLIISKVLSPQGLQKEFQSQIVASAVNIGRKYKYDEPHAQYVKRIALQIYDTMKEELGLETQARTLLEISAILHDVGIFIRSSDHQLHSQYIISNSDIFGLNKDSINIVSLVACYHRGSMPTVTDAKFHALPRTDRMVVLKLAAILRIADSLDRSHRQRINKLEMEFSGDSFIIKTVGTHDTKLERLAVSEKGNLFEAVFGYNILIS